MRRLMLITTPALVDTNQLIGAACAARDLHCTPVDAQAPGATPVDGDLLYCAAASPAALALERRWWRPTLGSVHGPAGPDVQPDPATLARLGPRTCLDPVRADAAALLRQVDELGGFPVVLKVPGGEGGRGVMRADSPPALLSLLDYLPPETLLLEYFPHVLAFRIIVVADEVAVSEAWCPPAWDFRTNAGGLPLGVVTPPREARDMALQACAATGVHFAGVDILQNDAGALRLAEVNCPCSFSALQAASGVDVAGRLIDLLLARAAGGG